MKNKRVFYEIDSSQYDFSVSDTAYVTIKSYDIGPCEIKNLFFQYNDKDAIIGIYIDDILVIEFNVDQLSNGDNIVTKKRGDYIINIPFFESYMHSSLTIKSKRNKSGTENQSIYNVIICYQKEYEYSELSGQ